MPDFDLGRVMGEDAPKIESIEKTSTSGLVDTYTITLDDGSEYTFTVTNGSDGSEVSITQVLSSGTKLATLTIDGVDTDLYCSSGVDIVTSWESTLSDVKVPSEKLTKNTIDMKLDISQTSYKGKNVVVDSSTGDITFENKPTIPTKTSDLNNDSGFITSSSLPTKTSDLTNDGDDGTHPFIDTSDLVNDLTTGGTTKALTAEQGKTLNTNKQDKLVSGTNIKTINNNSLLGSGNITISGGGSDVGTFTDLQTLITNNTIIILDKDYVYDSSTDSSLSDGITINKNITIIGNGHIIDGNNTTRAFGINGNYTFTLIDLIIQNCYSTGKGGSIYSQGSTINISNVSFIKNNTTNDGGAIYASSGGAINIINSLFNWNHSSSWGGAIKSNGATLTMQNSSFNGNTANKYADIDCSSSTNVINCNIPNIVTSCHNVTNKPYLTDHQSLSGYLTTSDIVNDLTTGGTTKALSAEQGKVLYDLIDGVEEDMLL